MNEKLITLKNTSNVDITNYPIAEAMIDGNGNARKDDVGQILTTGTTLTWSLKAGEEATFPQYVGEYLLGIYAFLEDVNQPSYIAPAQKEFGRAVEGGYSCNICDDNKVFADKRAIGLHVATKHSDRIV